MTEMIERVARAIDDAVAKWQPGSPQRIKEMAARAAIEAMREPTDDVAEIMSGHAANGYVDWRDLHRAMIDAALEVKAGDGK